VLSGDLGTELDLSTITVGLELERTEYKPDTISAVLYTPEQANCTVKIFRSVKMNIVGESSRERSELAFRELKYMIISVLAEE
jgi:transcription initiation factor TFIID TATA-box-binding protein